MRLISTLSVFQESTCSVESLYCRASNSDTEFAASDKNEQLRIPQDLQSSSTTYRNFLVQQLSPLSALNQNQDLTDGVEVAISQKTLRA